MNQLSIAEEMIVEKEEKNNKSLYGNPLFQNIQGEKLTKENFSLYQKDLGNILTRLIAYTEDLGSSVTGTDISDPLRVDVHMGGIKQQCKLLGEYCKFFKQSTETILLPYQYLGDIAHKFKGFDLCIQAFISIYNKKKGTEERQNFFKEIKDIIYIMSKEMGEANSNRAHIEFRNDIQYEPQLFFPADSTNNIIKPQIAVIQEKEIIIKNMLPKNFGLNSYKTVFEIVMNNLISNAIKFTPENGEINIGIEKEDENSITFFVKDSGVGIPTNVNVFERGYSTSSTDGIEGTGLGLSESQSFLKIVKGYLSHKENIPSGTVFSLSLPKKNR